MKETTNTEPEPLFDSRKWIYVKDLLILSIEFVI